MFLLVTTRGYSYASINAGELFNYVVIAYDAKGICFITL